MNRNVYRLSTLSLAALCVLPLRLDGAKPPSDQPAAITFRCATSAADCPSGLVPDGIRGDGQSFTAVLNSNREMYLTLLHGGGRTIWLDFRNGPDPSCATCRRDFDRLFLDDVIVTTNVVDASGAEVANGLLSMPIGGTSASRVKIAFNRLNSLGQTIQWAVRFNPEFYPGSNHVTVRRLSSNTWEVEAYPTDRALLVSNVSRKNGTDQQEGPFYMPFKLTVVSPPS